MARPKSKSAQDITDRALHEFWWRGYAATGMSELVRATGASRHAIYSEFGGKHALYLSCFTRYQETIVTPAFATVEAKGARLSDIATYFEHQIGLAEKEGLPGPGCFVANASTERAPHDAETRAKVQDHETRLLVGFENALRNEASSRENTSVTALAQTLVIFATGLWTRSRTVSDAQPLRLATKTFLETVSRSLR